MTVVNKNRENASSVQRSEGAYSNYNFGLGTTGFSKAAITGFSKAGDKRPYSPPVK